MIHSGSRNLGKRVAEKYHKIAVELCRKWKTPIPNYDLAVLPIDTQEAQQYLADMEFCVQFSFMNRLCMLENVIYAVNRVLGTTLDTKIRSNNPDVINIHHNYAAIEHHFGKNVWVHRKGATRVTPKILGIIPGSMGSTSYIVRGTENNADSFNSCSHGAGRVMSRTKAKETFTVEEFEKSMEGIASVDVNRGHLDESPMAYKNIDTVMNNQSDLVEIVHILQPVINMKG